jgi:hypothetical protein
LIQNELNNYLHFSNFVGQGLTSNKYSVLSVDWTMFNGIIYVLCSGDGQHLDVFQFDDFAPHKKICKFNLFILE